MRITPGHTAFTRIPIAPISSAAVRVMPTTACLDALYEPSPGVPIRPATLAVLMIEPRAGPALRAIAWIPNFKP